MKNILIFILFTSVSLAQSVKPEDILEKVKNNFSRVNDY